MKNFKTFTTKASLLLMVLTFIFTSCSKEESLNIEETNTTTKGIEISKEAIVNYQKEAELHKDATLKEIQQQLSLDDQFVDLYASTIDYSLLPILLNTDMEASELIEVAKNAEPNSLAKLYKMDEGDFSMAIDDLAIKYSNFFQKMKAQGVSPEKLEQAMINLDTNQDFQNKVQSYSKRTVQSCLGVCITGGFGCAIIQNVGASMRKFASCMGMPLGSARRKSCIAGVILEQLGHTIVCLSGTAGCIYGCEAVRDRFSIGDAERLSQGHKDTTIARMYNNARNGRPNVRRMQQRWSDGFYYGHRNGDF